MESSFQKWRRILVIAVVVFIGFQALSRYLRENQILKEVVARLQADSRVAQVLVTGVQYDEATHKNLTTIKFLEFDAKGEAMEPRYFTFSGNLIQFQSLVIRFDDVKVRDADKLRGKSAYLFMSAFVLDGFDTQVLEITKVREIPQGYKIGQADSTFEKKLWERFWDYALNPTSAQHMGIKNAQIEAPGTLFVPGMLYTIKIEHDGGLRIDAQSLPDILKGEKII